MGNCDSAKETVLCTDEYWNLSINEQAVDKWVLIITYLVVRFVQHLIGAYYVQGNRELLQVLRKRRFSVSSCCPLRGVYKQMVLQFSRSICHVITFILILQKNWVMFVFLILLDVAFVYIRFLIQGKDIDYKDAKFDKDTGRHKRFLYGNEARYERQRGAVR